MSFNLSVLVFSSLQQKDEVYLNLVLDYVPETVYRVARHYSRAKQTLPMVYVKVNITESGILLPLWQEEADVVGFHRH